MRDFKLHFARWPYYVFCVLLAAWHWGCLGKPSNLSLSEEPKENKEGKDIKDSALNSWHKEFGIYQWDKDSSYAGGLQQDINRIGISPKYALYFVDKERGFPKEIVEFNESQHIHTVLSQELCTYADKDNPHILDSILQGKWDAYFHRFAKAAKASNQIVYYRFGYEMNGDWFAWGEQPEKFTKAWRRAWKIFHDEKANNVKWVFSANVVWGSRTVTSDILPYYPGTRYVDVVGLDGYNFGDNYSRKHTWQSYQQVFQSSLNGMKKHFKGKPLWITEIGCADGARKAAWIQDFFQHFNADPAIRVFVWFNENKQYAGEPNWRFDSDGDSLKKFRQWAMSHN